MSLLTPNSRLFFLPLFLAELGSRTKQAGQPRAQLLHRPTSRAFHPRLGFAYGAAECPPFPSARAKKTKLSRTGSSGPSPEAGWPIPTSRTLAGDSGSHPVLGIEEVLGILYPLLPSSVLVKKGSSSQASHSCAKRENKK